ncbi:MAG: DUF2807 domain-containing protein [Chloroflexi bacterium]|nr:DUF2807 domain-containing protein [Chloroflexota bacterium]
MGFQVKVSARGYALVLVLVAALAGTACIDDVIAVHGSGDMESRELEFTDLAAIEVVRALSVEVSVEPGAPTRVAITMDENLFDHLIIEDRAGMLVLDATRNIRPSDGARIHVTVGRLDLLDASGASEVTVAGVVEESRVRLQASGASCIRLADVVVGELDIDVSGAALITVETGRVTELRAEASGASTVDTSRVEAIDAEVHANGASDIKVAAARSATGQASGASTVAVFGSPGEVDVTTSGASSVERR